MTLLAKWYLAHGLNAQDVEKKNSHKKEALHMYHGLHHFK